jgi:hypothetical protein
MIPIYISSSNPVEVAGLKDKTTGSYVNSATVTFTLKNSANAAVSGATAVAMTYVVASNGKYQGTLPNTVSLTEGAKYWLEITATSSTLVGFRRIECYATYRGAT